MAVFSRTRPYCVPLGGTRSSRIDICTWPHILSHPALPLACRQGGMQAWRAKGLPEAKEAKEQHSAEVTSAPGDKQQQ